MFGTDRQQRELFAYPVLLWILIVSPAWAQTHMRGRPAPFRGPVPQRIEVNEGCVIFDDAYVPPPYDVRWERPTVFVNDRAVLTVSPTQLSTRSFADGRRRNRAPFGDYLEYVGNHLRNGGLILGRAEQPAVLVTPGRALRILEVLIGEEPEEAKVRHLAAITEVPLSAEEWAELASTFEAPDGLAERVAYYQTEFAAIDIENTSASRSVFRIMTLAGFALAAWALGTLIRCRPPLGHEEAATETRGLWDHQVVRLALMIVVLGVHDLICTLFANDQDSFLELNTLAAPLLSHGPSVVAFKLSLTLGAAVVFWVARSCRLARISSWWMGVVYTVLILRWTTCSSVFIA